VDVKVHFRGFEKIIAANDSDWVVDPRCESRDKGPHQRGRFNVVHAPLKQDREVDDGQ
jgi:hypothetical protein